MQDQLNNARNRSKAEKVLELTFDGVISITSTIIIIIITIIIKSLYNEESIWSQFVFTVLQPHGHHLQWKRL